MPRGILSTNSKIEKNFEEIVCLTSAGSLICCGFKEHRPDHVRVENQVVVSLGSQWVLSIMPKIPEIRLEFK